MAEKGQVLRPAARKSLVGDARAVVEACAGWNSRLLARRITRFLERRMAGAGLSVAQFGLMAQIAAAADDTLGALAEKTGLEQSTLSRNLRTLEGKGLVEIAAAGRDLRRRTVWLTERGAHRLEAAIPAWHAAHAALDERLSSAAVRGLSRKSEGLLRD